MKAMYKCRLCGEVFCNSTHTSNKKLVHRLMVELTAGLLSTEPLAPQKTEIHHCGGDHAGSLGLADFQGWEKEECDNGET